MDNLFKSSMTLQETDEINAIKRNKEFALRLMANLSEIYQIFERVKDLQKSVSVEMRRNSNYLATAFFSANKDGVTFSSSVLGYYESSTIIGIGELYERYIVDGTKPKRNDSFTKGDHSEIEFKIKLVEGDADLIQRLRDVMYLLDRQGYNKKF